MNTCLLLLSAFALGQSRFLAPSIQTNTEPVVQIPDSTLLVDAPTLRFTHHTNLTDTRFKSGDGLNFYCEAVGTPMLNVYWTLDGHLIQGHRVRSNLENNRNKERVMIGQNIVGSRLELECIDERMTGTLSCIVDNGVVQKKTSALISTTGPHECPRIRPARPQIGTWTKSRIEEINNAVVFQCRKAAAGVKIRWENENGEKLKREDGYVALPNGDLLIPSLQWEHMGSYFCIASSEQGEDRTESFVFPTDKDAPEPSGDAEDYEEMI